MTKAKLGAISKRPFVRTGGEVLKNISLKKELKTKSGAKARFFVLVSLIVGTYLLISPSVDFGFISSVLGGK